MSSVFQPEFKLLDRLHDAAICCDLEGQITYCNAAAERIYGYAREELVGRNVACLYPESELPKMTPLLQEVMARGQADRKLLNVTQNGREFVILLSVSLLSDSDGTPMGMIGFSIDLTELEKAEQALRQSEMRARAAREAAGAGTWHWDISAGALWWDDISDALLDTDTAEEHNYATFMERVHPEDRERLDLALRKCMENGEPYREEYRVVHRDGSVHWISGRGRLYQVDGKRSLQMFGTATDITAQKIAEENLRAAEAKYRVLYDSPMIGVALGDLDAFTAVNDTFCRIVGYSREELTSGAIRWEDITPPEHLPNDFIALQQLTETGSCTPFEKEYIRKDGERVRIILGAALVSREPFAWSCFILDVTSQHRALSALRASEQMAAAAKMGSLLAHEINNPLAALTNVVYLLRHGPHNLTREELLLSAEESLARITRITRQMVGIYGSTEQVSNVSVMSILQDTLSGYSTRICSKQLVLENRNEVGEGSFRGVEPELRRLLSALIENAIEHAPVRGKVKVHLFRGREWNAAARGGLRIVVSDNGPGIPKEGLSRIFEPFSSTHKGPARGLGMWAGKSVVDKSKGKIKVRSMTQPGKSGTCVSVFLPEAEFEDSTVV